MQLIKTCKEIAKLIGKDEITVSKEIFKRRKRIENGRYRFNPANKECKTIKRFPFVCNGCPKRTHCTQKYKYLYDSDYAETHYRELLVSSRDGINMTLEEKVEFDTVLQNGIERGQSIYHIVSNNKDRIHCSTRTAYRIVEHGETIVQNIDLRRKCKLKPRKKYKPTKDTSKVRIGRSYNDFLSFYGNNPGIGIVEIDTVEGPRDTSSKCLLTIHFTATHFMIGILLDSKTKANVTNAFIELQMALGKELYSKLFYLILTDRGEEFLDHISMECYYEDGEQIANVFFCNSYSSYQKGAIEENHTLIRYVLPKGTSMDNLSQNHIDLLMSHINSYSRLSIDYNPFVLFSSLYGL